VNGDQSDAGSSMSLTGQTPRLKAAKVLNEIARFGELEPIDAAIRHLVPRRPTS
jgi:hypothetical protein